MPVLGLNSSETDRRKWRPKAVPRWLRAGTGTFRPHRQAQRRFLMVLRTIARRNLHFPIGEPLSSWLEFGKVK
jgi:hypothetical protein